MCAARHREMIMQRFFDKFQVQVLRRGGGILGPCTSKSLLVPPKREVCPLSEVCALKESNRPGATGVYFKASTPQNTACASKSVSKISLRKKNMLERED